MSLTKTEIKSYLNTHFPDPYYSGGHWSIGDRSVDVFRERGGSKREEIGRGIFLNKPLETLEQVDAVAHLLLETYSFRKPLSLGSLTIPGDKTFRTQEELLAILVA